MDTNTRMTNHDEDEIDSRILEAISHEIKSIKDELDIIHRNINHIPLKEHLTRDLKIADSYLDRIKISKSDNSDTIFKALTIVGKLNHQMTIIKNKITGYLPKLKSVFITLKNMIQNLSSYLWQLLSSYTKLKEWSVTGGASLNNLFGLNGKMQIQLVFKR